MAPSPPRDTLSSFLPSTCPNKVPRAVKFLPEAHVIPIESPWDSSELYKTKMEQKLFQTFPGDQVTDNMLGEAAKLFNENYGIWGELSHSPGKHDAMSLVFCLTRFQENPLGSAHVVCGSNTFPTPLLQATRG